MHNHSKKRAERLFFYLYISLISNVNFQRVFIEVPLKSPHHGSINHELKIIFLFCLFLGASSLIRDDFLNDVTEYLQIQFGRSGCAVGLSAISFSATLQKDAAPIPNASKVRPMNFSGVYIFVNIFSPSFPAIKKIKF